MKKILLSIEKLLIANDHAVIPGLGGFVIQQQSAHISGGTIYPPIASISFNPLIQHTDGILAISVSRELNISYREAVKLIEKETASFLNQLKKNKKADFGRIGTFRMDRDAHLLFTPAEHADFLPANFGLKSLKLPVNKAAKSNDIVFTLSARHLMKYAAVFVTLIALFFSTEINDTSHVIKADFYSLNQVDLPEITVTPTIPTFDDTLIPDNTPLDDEYAYKVVVAVFQTEINASAYCDQLIAQNFNESEVINNASNAKVSIRTFPDLISAVNFMEQIRHQDQKFKDAWVMKTKSSS